MAALLNEIEWGEPLVSARPDLIWEAEIKRRGGQVFEIDRRIAPNHWLREVALGLTVYRPVAMPMRLYHIGATVTAQENACRYCYGANRAYMKILGYSEDFIRRMERDLHLAELDEKFRAFIAFCRSLARSRPRPSRAATDHLVEMGFSRLAVSEMAGVISLGCFYNRVSTFIACPPEHGFERMANGPMGRVFALMSPLMRLWSQLRPEATPDVAALDAQALAQNRFREVLVPLAGLPLARIMKNALEGAFASDVLDRSTKALMFAVVARTLECALCESCARDMLLDDGIAQSDIDLALANLHSDHLRQSDAGLLSWARATVYYDIAAIQRESRELLLEIGENALIEAIGVASLANAIVRMAMLHA